MTVLMYMTEPDQEAFPFAEFDALAVALLAGNDEDGWENIGSNGWEHYENENMTVYSKRFHRYERQGRKMPGFDVDGRRYYFQVGMELSVQGLSKNGKIIDRQGG